MPMTPGRKAEYRRKSLADNRMSSRPDWDCHFVEYPVDAPELEEYPDSPEIKIQGMATGRRRVGQPLPIRGPEPVSRIVRRDGIVAFNHTTGEPELHQMTEINDPTSLAKISITQARRIEDLELKDTLNHPRQQRTLGYTRDSRLTPKRIPLE